MRADLLVSLLLFVLFAFLFVLVFTPLVFLFSSVSLSAESFVWAFVVVFAVLSLENLLFLFFAPFEEE